MKYIFSVLFMSVLFLPILNSLTTIFGFDRTKENRTFNDSLNIDIRNLDRFPKDCENYLNDNFEFRKPLISAYHEVILNLFQVSPHPESVEIGNNGRYFMTQAEQAIYSGKLNFSDDELTKFEREWQRRKEYLDKKGIAYYWVICPFSQNVYGDQMPLKMQATKAPRRTNVLKKRILINFPNLIIDPVPELLKARKNGEKVFYKNDNHWNLKAGEVVAKQIIKIINARFPEKDIRFPNNYYWKKSIKKGGIYEGLLGLDELREKDEQPVFRNEQAEKVQNYGFPVTPNFPYPELYEMRFIHKFKKDKLKVLIIRDSFAEQLLPFLKESFGETVFIFDNWKYKLNEEIIEQFNPDIVLFIGLETHIQNIIE
jgi:hypothetical protein